MPRRIAHPLQDGVWIELPDVWLGLHAQRRDQALEAAEGYHNQTLSSFGVAMALLEDWSLPGMNGNPEKWDFARMELALIGWVIATVIPDFNACFDVPKNSSAPPSDG